MCNVMLSITLLFCPCSVSLKQLHHRYSVIKRFITLYADAMVLTSFFMEWSCVVIAHVAARSRKDRFLTLSIFTQWFRGKFSRNGRA